MRFFLHQIMKLRNKRDLSLLMRNGVTDLNKTSEGFKSLDGVESEIQYV